MEQTVWLYFGIITVVLGLGIVGKLVIDHRQDIRFHVVERSMGLINNQCNFVCQSPQGSLHSVDVEFPSGIIIETIDDKVCALYKNTTNCVPCGCTLRTYRLDLEEARFDTHVYKCKFERMVLDGISMECQG